MKQFKTFRVNTANLFKKIFFLFRDLFYFFYSVIFFILKSTTPQIGHQSLINLFCLTRGRSNDFMSCIIALIKPGKVIAERSLIGLNNEVYLDEVDTDLKRNGFHIFNQKLPEHYVNFLSNYALTHPATVRGLGTKTKHIIDINHPLGTRYDFDMQELLNIGMVQDLIVDSGLLNVAQKYLKTIPIIDVVGLWWHTNFSNQPDSNAAQLFHFDMDRIKWIKFFFYLTDVSSLTGPHIYIAKSHRTGGIPSPLLKHGYARLSDADIKHFFNSKSIKEFIGSSGTMFAEDTRGLHKGTPVLDGARLVFQIQYSNSLFGAKYNKPVITKISDQFKQAYKKQPKHFSNLILR